MRNKQLLNRAKYVDEPYVRHRLEETFPENRYSLGDVESDWEHADINMITPKGMFKLDVKRCLPKYVNSPNFTFISYKNGNHYPLVDNGYIAFIDDITGDIYLISHIRMREYIKKYPIMKNIKDIEYIILKKKMLQQENTVIKGNQKCAQFLLQNADIQLFDF